MPDSPTFKLVNCQPGHDWKQHDRQQEQLRTALQQNAPAAKARQLDSAAENFRPSPELQDAINVALSARVPLLLTGEPGTGKTQVAWFLKRYFGITLFEYQVRSDSLSSDLRYDFDAVAYLRDAYLAQHSEQPLAPETPGADPRSDPKYLKPGALWRAFEHQGDCVLLIDEIDKAPRDFPNDILQEIDQHRFAHPFHPGDFIRRTGSPPITIITSNAERRLPDAFLRRCIVHHIELTRSLLETIMAAWQSEFPRLDDDTQTAALDRFTEIRNLSMLDKKPGPAELLLWLTVLSAQKTAANKLTTTPLHELPALSCLIKHHDDYLQLKNVHDS